MYALGARIHAGSEDRAIPMDATVTRVALAELISSGHGFVLVDDEGGKVTGVLVGFVQPLWYSKKKFALALVAYAERPGAFVYMVKRFVRWAIEDKGCAQVVLDTSYGGERGGKSEAIYQRLPGFERMGSIFIVRGKPCRNS